MYRHVMKRALDIVFALALLGLFCPLWLLTSIIIRIDSPGRPLFKQQRIGLDGRPFTMMKFRSMIPEAYKYGRGFYFDGEDDWRITKVGRFLRRTSLDEIPQLINVLIGDMSIVGPRPMLPYQYEHLSPEQRYRCTVRPGITGLAQVRGRNNIPWSRRIELDILYIQNLSVLLDLRILGETALAVFRHRDISYDLSEDEVEDFIPKA